MTTSALLSASHRFHVLSSATSVTARRSPIYSVRPLIPCCGPYAGGSSDCFGRFLHRWPGLHPFCKGSATTFIHAPDYAWSFSRRCNLRFMLRPGTLLAPLRTGRLLPSLHAARSPRPHVDYDYTSFRLARGRTFTGRSDSLMGCTQNRTKREGGPKIERCASMGYKNQNRTVVRFSPTPTCVARCRPLYRSCPLPAFGIGLPALDPRRATPQKWYFSRRNPPGSK